MTGSRFGKPTGHPKSDFTTLRHRRAATEAGAGLTLVNNSLVAWHRLPALDAADVGGLEQCVIRGGHLLEASGHRGRNAQQGLCGCCTSRRANDGGMLRVCSSAPLPFSFSAWQCSFNLQQGSSPLTGCPRRFRQRALLPIVSLKARRLPLNPPNPPRSTSPYRPQRRA
jgi:hypothetical protein